MTNDRRFLSGFNGIGWLRGYDTATHQPLGTLVPYILNDQWLVVSPTGNYTGPRSRIATAGRMTRARRGC